LKGVVGLSRKCPGGGSEKVLSARERGKRGSKGKEAPGEVVGGGRKKRIWVARGRDGAAPVCCLKGRGR